MTTQKLLRGTVVAVTLLILPGCVSTETANALTLSQIGCSRGEIAACTAIPIITVRAEQEKAASTQLAIGLILLPLYIWALAAH